MIDHDGVGYEDLAVPTSEVVPSRLTRQPVMMVRLTSSPI